MTVGLNVHLYPSPMTHESRIFKETGVVDTCATFDGILIVGTAAPGLPEREVMDGRREILRLPRGAPRWLPSVLRKALGVAGWSARVLATLGSQPIACVNCHSLPVLPVAVMLKWRTGARLVYDAHELETEANGLNGVRRAASKVVERALIRFADETIVVSDGIADWYHRAYGGHRPAVVLNCPPRRAPRRSNLLGEALAVPEGAALFLYQGILGAGRGIELLLDAFMGLDDPRKVIAFMGMGPLEGRIAECARRSASVRLHPAVPPDRLMEYTASADVGMCLFEDSCLSHRYCMPNKLFEYLAAGVPAVVSNLPEISRVVTEFTAGWVMSPWSSESLRAVIGAIDAAAIARARGGAARAAEVYSWERQVPILKQVYERLGFVTADESVPVPSPQSGRAC